MDRQSVERWFSAYLAEFMAVGRGDSDDVQGFIRHYDVPLLLSTDAVCRSLRDEEQVLAFAQQQVDDLRSADYDRSRELTGETVVLNHSCALHRSMLSRLRADGTAIATLEVTYLMTDGGTGQRISALVVHTPR